MARLTPDDVERFEAHERRGLRWFGVALGFMVAGIFSLAAGAPYNVSLFLLSSVFGAAAMSAKELVPTFRELHRLRRARKPEDDG